jgi:hypothetical protein
MARGECYKLLRMLHNVPIATLASFAEACAAHPNQPVEVLARFAGFSVATAKRALPTLEALGLAERAQSQWSCSVQDIRRGAGHEAVRPILAKQLLAYRPFEAMCEGLLLGEDEHDAIRKTEVLLGQIGTQKDLNTVLVPLGLQLDLLSRNADGALQVQESLARSTKPAHVLDLAQVTSESAARFYCALSLGRLAFNSLDEIDRRLLTEGVLAFKSSPSDAAEKCGQALEDYLRELAKQSGLATEASKLNGAMQLASLLISKSVIHTHHQKLVEAASTVRNATAHKKDKKTLAPWVITQHGALAAVVTALVAIRSIFEFVTKGTQEL